MWSQSIFHLHVTGIINVSIAFLGLLRNPTESCNQMNEIHQLLLRKQKAELISSGD